LLSYQHGFHAGNHADVLKHATLCALIRALTAKPKPFFYLDTHAGNGYYDIEGQNHQDEVAALKLTQSAEAPGAIEDYIKVIKGYTAKGSYPGSPLVAWDMLELLASERGLSKDALALGNMHLSELHPGAYASLKECNTHTNFHCHHRDGFELLNAVTPPKPNRGLVIVDPPYEQASEYMQVFESISQALRKWKNGIFCIWYPLLSPQRIDRDSKEISPSPKHGLSENMVDAFTTLGKELGIGVSNIQFANCEPSTDIGMYGSGMLIFNPPWQLESTLQSILEYLENNVQSDSNNLSSVTVLVPSP
jgi:23S rRNA (adenine2030-N6)-methyltransferase